MEQMILDDPSPHYDSSQSALFVPFICGLVSGTILLTQYYLRDLDLQRTISTGTVRRKDLTSGGFPLVQRHKLPTTQHVSIWKVLRLVTCLLLLTLAVVGVALADPCAAKYKPNPGNLEATGLKHGPKHPKHHRNRSNLCLSRSQSAHLTLVFFHTYTALLALLAVTLASDFSGTCHSHLTPLLLIALCIDILTISTSSTHPVLAWIQIALLAFSSLLIPLLLLRFANSIRYKDPPPAWPSTGRLVVQNLTARYTEREPPVLENISFRVESGECVGVVGKIGCGKDALWMALLGSIWTEGNVFYDGLSTHTLNPSTLPFHIALISGSEIPGHRRTTIRQALDPQTRYDDAVLKEALERAAVGLDGSEIGLSESVRGLGVRNRWGVELARTIVRKSKVIIVDETLMSTHFSPDPKFYFCLRKALPTSTILIVTNNLQNICVGVDKILVLNAGSVSEYDMPRILLKKQSGAFRSLVDDCEEDIKERVYQTFCA